MAGMFFWGAVILAYISTVFTLYMSYFGSDRWAIIFIAFYPVTFPTYYLIILPIYFLYKLICEKRYCSKGIHKFEDEECGFCKWCDLSRHVYNEAKK